MGTFLLVFFGCGIVHSAVLFDSVGGIWQIAVVWALAIAIAIYACSRFSDAHFNPAVTLAFAVWGDLKLGRILPYWISQLAGAFCGAVLLYGIYSERIVEFESEKGIQRGSNASLATAMCYGEFTPNPGAIREPQSLNEEDVFRVWQTQVSMLTAMLAEAVGTAVLVFAIFSFSDSRGMLGERREVAALMIGLTVAALICLLAPITQAGFNPARDLGPRIFSSLAGWGDLVFLVKGPMAWFLIYIAAPLVGGLVGGGIQRALGRLPSK